MSVTFRGKTTWCALAAPFCIDLCVFLQGRRGVATRLPDLGGVQRAAATYFFPPFPGKGLCLQLLFIQKPYSQILSLLLGVHALI